MSARLSSTACFFLFACGASAVDKWEASAAGASSENAPTAAQSNTVPPPSTTDEVVPTRSSQPVSASASSASPSPPPKSPLPKGTVVLHVGDSFVHSGLTQRLRSHFEPLGVRYEVHAEKSTNSLDWSKRVPGLVMSTQPDLVLVTLGGNEIGSKYLEVEARAVSKIVRSIGDRPCVWTTPPLWMEESGVFDTIAANVAPCRFFETDKLVGSFIPRREDRIHPTMEGGAMWADRLFAFLESERTGQGKPWQLAPSPPEEVSAKGKRGPLPH